MFQSKSRSAKTWITAAAAFAGLATFCGQALALNDIGWLWTFEGTAPSGTGTTNGPYTTDQGFAGSASGVHASSTVWSSPVGNGSSESFSANTWNPGDYWQFAVTDTVGLSDIGLQFDQVSSTTGPRDFILQYSTDNGANFTDFANYSVGPNTIPGWSSAGAVAPAGLDTYNFDFRGVSGMDGNNVGVVFRLAAASPAVAAQMGQTYSNTTGTDRVDNVTIYYNYDPTQSPVPQPDPPPVLPATGDVVFGIGSGRKETTLELVQGSAVLNGGSKPAPYSSWTAQNFIRFVKFDNLGSQHNVHGNLLGVDPGAGPTTSTVGGGNIYSFATQGSIPSPAPQLIGSTTGLQGVGTRLGGLSVAPNNSKIALAGFDSGKVIVFDYTAGNGQGTGSPSLSNKQETSTAILGTGSNYSAGTQQGTAWKDNNTVLAFAGDGKLYEVDATTMATTQKADMAIATATQSSTALAYNPGVAPNYVYATYSSFVTTGSITTNKLFVFDVTANYAEVTGGGIDFSTSAFAIRDIALDASGNLFISTAGSSGGGQGRIEYIPGVTTPGSIAPNSSVDWYLDEVFGGVQNGLDIGFAPPAGLAGDFNSDGKVDAGDYVTWRKNNGTNNALANDNGLGTPIGPAHYNLWRQNFGNPPGSGSGLDGAAVPEPAGVVLLAIGLVSICLRLRRRGA
jgi:hypothetical protein